MKYILEKIPKTGLDWESFDRWLREMTRQQHNGSIISVQGTCNAQSIIL